MMDRNTEAATGAPNMDVREGWVRLEGAGEVLVQEYHFAYIDGKLDHSGPLGQALTREQVEKLIERLEEALALFPAVKLTTIAN